MTLNMTLNILKKSLLYHERLEKLSTVQKMCSSVNYSHMLRSIFEKCVDSVKPKSLFDAKKIELVLPSAIRVDNEFVEIQNRKCHVVGFGKAVLGMAVQMERVLGDSLVSGILSVPVGTNKKFAMDKDMQLQKNSVIEVFEGAKNNLPDTNAEITAKKIFEYVGRLTENDVLFVLISGGGSALLPVPVSPITLDEKINVIKLLASRGANINELNCVRIEISSIKGGKLALAASNAHKTVSLIISDICGDPLNLIASGPTFIQQSDKGKAKQILEKFDLVDSIPESIKNCLSNSSLSNATVPIKNSSIHIIGNNNLAINVAVEEMKNLQIRGICMSKRIEGDIELLSCIYCELAEAIYQLASGKLDPRSFQNLINSLGKTIMFEEDFCAAAGAVVSLDLANDCNNYEYGSIDTYINNNDSYILLKRLADGKYNILTGHTGTNVMDLHFLIIPF